MSQPLEGQVALVTGATRAAGRGIAVELGAAGATVYCTGRTTRQSVSPMHRPETIEETAELVTAAGGKGIAMQVDHNDIDRVADLLQRIDREQDGRLDVLVNDAWGGDRLVEWDVQFWQHDLRNGLEVLHNGVDTHIVTTWHAAPLMVKRRAGLVIGITDGDMSYMHDHLFYDLPKKSVMRLAVIYTAELGQSGITSVAISPGWLRSEAMLEGMGVSEENWQDFYWRQAPDGNPRWLASESPRYTGRAVTALAGDRHSSRWSGKTMYTRDLASIYRFTDVNGTRPGHGIYSLDHLDGGPPRRDDYVAPGPRIDEGVATTP